MTPKASKDLFLAAQDRQPVLVPKSPDDFGGWPHAVKQGDEAGIERSHFRNRARMPDAAGEGIGQQREHSPRVMKSRCCHGKDWLQRARGMLLRHSVRETQQSRRSNPFAQIFGKTARRAGERGTAGRFDLDNGMALHVLNTIRAGNFYQKIGKFFGRAFRGFG